MTEKNVEQDSDKSRDPLDRRSDVHRQGLTLKVKTAAELVGKPLDSNKTRSRPLPQFAGDELFMRLVPDGADSGGKYARKPPSRDDKE